MSESQRPAKTRTAIFPLPEGDIVLTFPDELSADSVSDLEAYLLLKLKQARRKAAAQAALAGKE